MSSVCSTVSGLAVAMTSAPLAAATLHRVRSLAARPVDQHRLASVDVAAGDDPPKVTVCGHACRRQWLSDSFTGIGHPNWKGGGNGSYGKGWNSVRRNALERDGYQCVICDSSKAEIGRNPDVHHIVPVRSFIESAEHTREDAHFLDNVVSLCISCHRKADFGKISRDRLRSLTDSEE
jgi:5-methylcytosine-specific restriction endonuclease McrA